MKYLSFNLFWLLITLLLLGGCASQVSVEERRNNLLARPLTELKQEMTKPDSYASKTGWKESTYPLTNGNSVYIEPVSFECFIHWEISQSGLIVGSQLKGNSCKQREDKNNIINTRTSSQ